MASRMDYRMAGTMDYRMDYPPAATP